MGLEGAGGQAGRPLPLPTSPGFGCGLRGTSLGQGSEEPWALLSCLSPLGRAEEASASEGLGWGCSPL